MGDRVVLRPSGDEPYELCRADSGAIRFQVRSRSGAANFTFTAKDRPRLELYQVLLGPESRITDAKSHSHGKYVHTPGLITNQFKEFWVTWYNDIICIGLIGELEPFIKYMDMDKGECKENYIIGFIKFHKMCGPWTVDWIFDTPLIMLKPICHKKFDGGRLRWVQMNNHLQSLPPDAMIGGFQNEPIYIARSYHNGSMCPGKYVPSKRLAYVPWGHREHAKQDFEILCGYNAEWIKSKSNIIPQNAFIAGSSEVRGEPLYIGRAMHDGNLIPGKVHVLYKTCYLPYKGKEVEMFTYEILVLSYIIPRGVEFLLEDR